MRQHIRQRRQNFFLLALPAAFEQLLALARHAGNHQAAAVQHADQAAQFFEGDFLRRKLLFEALRSSSRLVSPSSKFRMANSSS